MSILAPDDLVVQITRQALAFFLAGLHEPVVEAADHGRSRSSGARATM